MTCSTKTKVFLVCPGLGHVSRGFESFTRECFDALKDHPALDVTLFKGGGHSGMREIVLPNLPRNRPLGSWLGNAIGKSGYIVEQATFGLALLPHIMRQKPDVIYLSDFCLGHYLWHWRHLTRQSYKILFCNGGPTQPPFPHWDHVHQVAQEHLQKALIEGEPPEKQTLIVHGFQISAQSDFPTPSERVVLLQRLGLPEKMPIVLSVGLVNSSYKRMDYIIREVAAIKHNRPYLLMLGQQDSETPEIRKLAEDLLGMDNFDIRTVAYHETTEYYKCADVFVLASVDEGFGRVFVEALSHGLPCVAHDYAVPRFVLGELGYFANLQQTGDLRASLESLLDHRFDINRRTARHQYAYEGYSWQSLIPQYVEMIQKCASS